MTIAKLFFSIALLTACATAQTWSGSGSNGSDGALTLNTGTPGVVNNVLIFDPVALNLDLDGDNIYHFTTITISGITVKFRANKMRAQRPVIWLATGAVNIAGILDLDGENGHPASTTASVRRPSEPGPGGFPGGVGALIGGSPQPGAGPGAGRVASPANAGCSAGHAIVASLPTWCTSGGSAAYGNSLLQPLIGGSGGSGARPVAPNYGGGGGAGGGAIRINSNVHIAFGTGINGNQAVGCYAPTHYIGASGGTGVGFNAVDGGGGSGGAIHLQAPVVAGCGTHLYVRGGGQYPTPGASHGRVRIDANGISVTADPVPALTGPLVDVPLPTNQPSIRVISVNGINVPANPQFGYTVPDLNLNTTSAVPVVVNAANIPVNTPVTLYLSTEPGGADVTTTVNLTGSLSNSTATANVTLPTGVSRMYVRAVW